MSWSYISLEEAKDFLRLDNDYNDSILEGLIDGIPDYIELATGLNYEQQEQLPLCRTVGLFLLRLWYYSENTDSYRVQKVIDGLLFSIKDIEVK